MLKIGSRKVAGGLASILFMVMILISFSRAEEAKIINPNVFFTFGLRVELAAGVPMPQCFQNNELPPGTTMTTRAQGIEFHLPDKFTGLYTDSDNHGVPGVVVLTLKQAVLDFQDGRQAPVVVTSVEYKRGNEWIKVPEIIMNRKEAGKIRIAPFSLAELDAEKLRIRFEDLDKSVEYTLPDLLNVGPRIVSPLPTINPPADPNVAWQYLGYKVVQFRAGDALPRDMQAFWNSPGPRRPGEGWVLVPGARPVRGELKTGKGEPSITCKQIPLPIRFVVDPQLELPPDFADCKETLLKAIRSAAGLDVDGSGRLIPFNETSQLSLADVWVGTVSKLSDDLQKEPDAAPPSAEVRAASESWSRLMDKGVFNVAATGQFDPLVYQPVERRACATTSTIRLYGTYPPRRSLSNISPHCPDCSRSNRQGTGRQYQGYPRRDKKIGRRLAGN